MAAGPRGGRRRGLRLEVTARRMLSRLDFMRAAVREAATRGMGKATLQLYNDAVMEAPAVPKRTGHLRGSGSALLDGSLLAAGLGGDEDENPTPVLEAPEEKVEGVIVGTVAFNTPYAARLHEHPEYQFKEPGTGGKYLEAKLAAHGREYMALVAQEIRAALEGG
jgi:hypothetical protein